MNLDASTYFQHLKAYINRDYVLHDGSNGRVILTEKYFRPQDVKPQERRIELLLTGLGMAFKLDHDGFDTNKKKNKPSLFHFLDDTAKPWSKRCDFVVFHVNDRSFHADCIEFKSKSLTAEKIVPQLKAGVCWVTSLKETIGHYTDDTRRVRIRKFVFAENDNPIDYVDANWQLKADPSVRYYHYNEVNDKAIATLQNASVKDI